MKDLKKVLKGTRDKNKLFVAVEKLWGLEIDKDIKKELMNILVWKIGEAPNGKYKLKYRSEGAIGIKDVKKLHHEHVLSRKNILLALLNAKSIIEVNDIINRIETCVVTRDEHHELSKTGYDGWDKYKKANKKVFDVSGNEPKRYL